MIHLASFISKYVTLRPKSLFEEEINIHKEKLSKKICNKSVLVIGGAGSIGSSFIKAILPFKPASLVVADINENALAELTRDLRSIREISMPDRSIPYPMDYASDTFEKMFISNKGFDIIANFSAHKHVRSEKDIFSVEALLNNNVLHMEDLIFSYSDKFPVKTARFANVAFSNGSLPAGFLSRIEKQQPISAPLDVRRYFVSPEESGQICMLACMLGKNREIFFPKLDETQMKTFDEIAVKLLEEYGYKVIRCTSDKEAMDKAEALKAGNRDYPVIFSLSDTTGEKPYEEFYTDMESTDQNRFHSLGVVIGKDKPDGEKLETLLNDLEAEFNKYGTSKEKIVEIMKSYLPEFGHIETGKSLDSKM